MTDTTDRNQLADIIAESPVNAFGDTLYDAYFNVAPDMEKLATAILAAGFRPPARVVTTAEQAMDLRDGTLVVTRMGGSGYVWKGHVHATFPALYSLEWAIKHYGPLTVVWEPEEGE